MRYTVSKKADKKVEEDLNLIKKIIIKEINPVSIILIGGFGKGEGSFEIKNNKVIPLNDYDLYVVTRKKIREDKVSHVENLCSKAINRGGLEFVEHPTEKYDKDRFFHVDLRILQYNKLSKLLPTQRTHEIKNAMLIYGEDISSKVPEVKVSVSDAIRLLFNRMDHLLLSKDNTKEIKLIYAAKSIIDVSSAILIYKGKFHSSYRKRCEIFKTLNFPEELTKKVEWATNFKLKPDFNQDADKAWEDARYWVGFAFKYILKNHLDLKNTSWSGIAKAVHKKLPYVYFKPYLPSNFFLLAQYFLTLKYCLKCWKKGEFIIKPLFGWRDVGLKVAIPLFLYLYDEKDLARKYLKKITNSTEPLKERILKLYSIYYLQKLI